MKSVNKSKKIQELLIKHLMDNGHIELALPNGMKLQLGIVQEGEDGRLVKQDDYCWAIVSHKNREISIDSYNFDMRYPIDIKGIIVEDETIDSDGKQIKILSVV